jgi:hypothetical protein
MYMGPKNGVETEEVGAVVSDTRSYSNKDLNEKKVINEVASRK